MAATADAQYAEVRVELADRPDDSPIRCAFVPLSDADVSANLRALAHPQRTVFDSTAGHRVDSVSFQPCVGYHTQDRHVVQQLDVHGQKWTFTGVFDAGHLGDATVEHTAYHLPIIVTQFLQKAIPGPSAPVPAPDTVADILSRAITSFDDAIAGDILALFPGGIASLAARSDEEIRAVINDFNAAGVGANYQKARLCMYGTTALVALVDPHHENLWVANLGDSDAVLTSPGLDGRWQFEILNDIHNGDNESEVRRVRREHPGEPDAVLDGRVLGTIAPFRCIGDAPFKQPAEFTRRVLYNLYPGIPNASQWDALLARNRTPPYISARPDVTHRRLRAAPALLVLATDGLAELCEDVPRAARASEWARCVGAAYAAGKAGPENLALWLLREALGPDTMHVSQMLTLDMDTPWMDDTTIIVQVL
ncbi:protein serine/threonine phosphatase 2C [Auriscalpium vulgare]|uniref:Protein serine/threonine phosphatase 2C n=1 Tax=Auriscalpium vulgare TaxID=40419 RepID=A0ACB8RGU6_9AGAM|nr:protein serine/threonine phosphatase 2C [Auriscalpium vulgare]